MKGRVAVNLILNKCVKYRRLRVKPQTQQMADLSSDRLDANKPPFSNVGVDYFGPIVIKRGRSEQKAYGCIFTCLTTRAIHLELTLSLSTDAFINALQRFMCRRGSPNIIRSDNGTNFVGAQRELKAALTEWNKKTIHQHLLQQNVQWVFNPPAASHMGGVWERQIRTVRMTLLGVSNQQTLDFDKLSTLFCQVENIVNGRPLTKRSDNPDDPLPLTPNDLLRLGSGPVLPPGYFVEQDIYRRRWRQVQYLADLFWYRWIREYLPQLQQRQKWLCPKRNFRCGDLVLIVSENSPRSQWPLGLVITAHPGRDGLVRSVELKTTRGTLVRPVSKLHFRRG